MYNYTVSTEWQTQSFQILMSENSEPGLTVCHLI